MVTDQYRLRVDLPDILARCVLYAAHSLHSMVSRPQALSLLLSTRAPGRKVPDALAEKLKDSQTSAQDALPTHVAKMLDTISLSANQDIF